jgi:hypothetical protein
MIVRDRGELERENAQVLNLVQAMIGGVTPALRGASLECWEHGVRLHFLLACDTSAEREEVKDIVAEFEALQDGRLDVQVCVTVSTKRWAQGKLPGRRVFGRKEALAEDSEDAGQDAAADCGGIIPAELVRSAGVSCRSSVTTMPIEVICPGCGNKWPANEVLAGKTIRCPACSAFMTVPDLGAIPQESVASEAPGRPRRWPLGWLTFLGFSLLCTGYMVWEACRGPGPRGYNVITGVGLPYVQGAFGYTPRNIAKGIEFGLVLSITFGFWAAVIVKAVRWGVQGLTGKVRKEKSTS